MSRKGWLLFVALSLIWGVPYLFIRVAVREVPPPALVFMRTAPAALLILPFSLRRGTLRALLGQWRWVLAYTLAELAVPWLVLSHAEQRITSSLAGLLIATVPLIGMVIYRAAGAADRLDARRLLGLAVGFAGVAALVGLDLSGNDPAAIAEVGVVALCYALGPLIVTKRLAGLPSLGVITASLVLTAAGYLPAAVVTWPSAVSGETIAAIAMLAIVCTAVAFFFFFALIREVGPSRATVITYVNPLVAVLLGVAFLGEPFTLGIAVGMPLILLGSVLATAPATRASSTPAPPG